MNTTAIQLRKAKSTKERAIRVEWCVDNLTIDENSVFGLHAVVPSTSDTAKTYHVRINEQTMTAIDCDCDGYVHGWYCAHMEALDLFYSRIANILVDTTPVSEVMAEAQTAMEQFDRDCDPNAYEVLGSTKKVASSQPDTCRYCGHLCKGGICGKCAA